MERKVSIRCQDNALKVGDDIMIKFQRTLRIPDDDKTYPLPPGLGEFPLVKVQDFLDGDELPSHWRRRKGVIVPMWQKEAMYIQFSGQKKNRSIKSSPKC